MFPPRIILVRPSHPGNIGSAARAMKTMGLSELYLVSPQKFPSEEATALSTHASDILEKAVIVDSVLESLKDITRVYATSANDRAAELPCFTAREAAHDILQKNKKHKSAILFGPENHGLNNDDLLLAHAVLQIPTQTNYHSLNLASAVQIVVYELLLAQSESLASMLELEGLYADLERIAEKTRFLDPKRPGQLMARFRRLFNRTEMDQAELNILRGFLKALGI